MNYKETETSRMLKQCNDLLCEAIEKYALKRQEEIEAERSEPITLSNGLIVPKGRFIDTQRMYELDDEETENYIIISTESHVNISL